MATRLRLVSACVCALLVAACGSETGPSATGSEEATAPSASTSADAGARAAAVWVLGPGQSLQRSSTKFTALVSRLGCNGGVTGQVLPPDVHMGDSEIVVTFFVAPKQPDLATCPANDQIPYDIDLGRPLAGRALVDGHCLPGREAAATSFCTPDAIRFRP